MKISNWSDKNIKIAKKFGKNMTKTFLTHHPPTVKMVLTPIAKISKTTPQRRTRPVPISGSRS